jgi:hypothetical protein
MDIDQKRGALREVAFRLKLAAELLADASELAIGAGDGSDPETLKLVNRQHDLFSRWTEIAVIISPPPVSNDPSYDPSLEFKVKGLVKQCDEVFREFGPVNRLKDELRKKARAGDPPSKLKD